VGLELLEIDHAPPSAEHLVLSLSYDRVKGERGQPNRPYHGGRDDGEGQGPPEKQC